MTRYLLTILLALTCLAPTWAQTAPSTATIDNTVALESFESYGGAENQWHTATAGVGFTDTLIESKYYTEQSNSADDAKTAYAGSATTVNSQTEYVLSGSPSAVDDYYNGMSVVVYDGTSANSDPRDYLLCTDYVGSTGTITVDTAPDFTIQATDLVYVYPDPKWRNQGMRVRMQLANLLLNGNGTATGGVHLFGNYFLRNLNIIGVEGTPLILDRGNATNAAGRYFDDFDFEVSKSQDIHIRDCDHGIVYEVFSDSVHDGSIIVAGLDGGTAFNKLSDGNLAPTTADGVAYWIKGGATRFNGTVHSYGTGYGARIEGSYCRMADAYLENCAGAALHNTALFCTIGRLRVHTASMWIDEPIVYSNQPITIQDGWVELTSTSGYGGHEPPGMLLEGGAHGSKINANIKLADEACTGLTIKSNGVHFRGIIYADTKTEGQVGIELAAGVNNCVIEVTNSFNVDTVVKLNGIGHNNRIIVTHNGTVDTPIDSSLAGEGHDRLGANGEPKNKYERVDTSL